jgi:7,8-dihydropterin-6-yl-methyl-4-(beta-D-ribofuranosyl)aminobenzene 5'-phosphate synthase
LRETNFDNPTFYNKTLMEITILIDNNPHPEFGLHTEHGLSIYFEADGCKWLFDTGASGMFCENAARLGIKKIEEVDFLVLSHGHSDHTGGLEQFISVNKKARILISAEVPGKFFISYRIGRRDISTDPAIFRENHGRFKFVSGSSMITQNVGVVCNFPEIYETPKSNNKLFVADEEGERPDKFRHEIALVADSGSGLVVFSGCSHNGILNILAACSDFFNNSRIKANIGGTHLTDSTPENQYETEAEIFEIGQTITKLYPGMQLFTGHCTGTLAQKLFPGTMGANFKVFYSGATFTL